MSPLPLRVETKASDLPSGEKSGRDSDAGCAIRMCASPPFAGAIQMSSPETNAIERPSGENDGWESIGWALSVLAASRARAARRERISILKGLGPWASGLR